MISITFNKQKEICMAIMQLKAIIIVIAIDKLDC